MIFFYVTKDLPLKLGLHETEIVLKAPSSQAIASRSIPLSHIYFCIADGLVYEVSKIYKRTEGRDHLQIFTNQGKERIVSVEGFPVELDYTRKAGCSFIPLEKKLEQLPRADTLKIAIINGMSSSFGDSIVGLSALNVFYERALLFFPNVEIDLYQSDPAKTEGLYRKMPSVNAVYMLPTTVDSLLHYEAYIDMDAMICREEFNDQPLVDFYLEALSVDKTSVPAEMKRTCLRTDGELAEEMSAAIEALKPDSGQCLLFHPLAGSPIRSMPERATIAALEHIIENSHYTVFSVVKIDYSHPRFVDLSHLSTSFDRFVCIVSMMDALIAVDSSVYHIADSFNVPSVVLFTTIEPEQRIKYYSCADGILLNGSGNAILGKHFSTVKEDLEYAKRLWDDFDCDQVLRKLDALVKKDAR